MSALQDFPRITPFLWFDSIAEEAVDFYLTVFKNSRRLDQSPTAADSRGPKDKILTIAFELDGRVFTALNGGPLFKFTEAVSFVVRCDSQQEVDDYWAKLSAGGSESQCGWLKDNHPHISLSSRSSSYRSCTRIPAEPLQTSHRARGHSTGKTGDTAALAGFRPTRRQPGLRSGRSGYSG